MKVQRSVAFIYLFIYSLYLIKKNGSTECNVGKLLSGVNFFFPFFFLSFSSSFILLKVTGEIKPVVADFRRKGATGNHSIARHIWSNRHSYSHQRVI